MKLRNICTGLAAIAATMVSVGAAPSVAQDKKPYVIYLSNNFVGNDWRQQMQRVAQVSVDKGPLKGRVELHIEVAEGTVQAQINSLNNIIRQKPDAILVDASSDTALNPTIKKACDAGIVVISFDQVVTEPCALTLASILERIPAVMAEWMAVQLNGKGNVLLDRGLAGAPISAQLQEGYEKVLANYPDIKVIGYYNGEYALGPEQSGVAALLAAKLVGHPFGQHGRDAVPVGFERIGAGLGDDLVEADDDDAGVAGFLDGRVQGFGGGRIDQDCIGLGADDVVQRVDLRLHGVLDVLDVQIDAPLERTLVDRHLGDALHLLSPVVADEIVG